MKIVAALDEKYVIGSKGKIPWHLPEDFKHFKKTTLGGAVIMGRLTYESLGKPLPNRQNIVLTSRKLDGVLTATSLTDALKLVEAGREAFVIGGARVYADALPLADELILSHVKGKHQGDVFFPKLGGEWIVTKEEPHEKFTVKWYERQDR